MIGKLTRLIGKIGIALIVITLLGVLAFKVSPWPSALLIRYAFNSEAVKTNKALEPFVPSNVTSKLNLHYNLEDSDAYLDVYMPVSEPEKSSQTFPLIVWIHGGGLLSGSKEQVSNYCKILATKGFVVSAIDYTIAPEGKFPTPLIQTNKALSYLVENASRFKIDASNVILAGDSGGAFIAAQVANTIYNKNYAEITKVEPGISKDKLKALLLYCGIYNISSINTEGNFGSFMQTATWSYFGKKDISNDAYSKTASVLDYISSPFPPCFISAGNGDPLLSQSLELAEKLTKENIPATSLFFESDKEPALPHEYQFNLTTDAGQLALERSLQFLNDFTEAN